MSKLSSKNRGLGRGLDALFQDDQEVDLAAQADNEEQPIHSSRRMLPIDALKPGASQPRQVFDEAALDQLAESIEQHGLLQPLLVREVTTGEFEIIAGERRWRASQKARLHEVPVVVLEIDNQEALEIALVENLQREDLNPVEEANGYKRLIDEYGHTQEALAKAVGKSRPHVANMMRLLLLPDVVLYYLEAGDLSMGHARALINVDDAGELARQIINGGLSVRETEALVASGRAPQKSSKSSKKPSKDADLMALENDLSMKLGMHVVIKPKGKKNVGTVEITYQSLDQFDDILKHLKG